MRDRTRTSEQLVVTGENLLAKVRQVLHEGNVRRIILKREDGTSILEIPVTAGVAVGVLTAAVAPALVAVGAVAAVVSQVTLEVEREGDRPDQDFTAPHGELT